MVPVDEEKEIQITCGFIFSHTGQTQTSRPEIGDNTYAPPLPPHATPTHVRMQTLSAFVTNKVKQSVVRRIVECCL